MQDKLLNAFKMAYKAESPLPDALTKGVGQLVNEYTAESDVSIGTDKTGKLSLKVAGRYAMEGLKKIQDAKKYVDAKISEVNKAIDTLAEDITRKGIVDDKGKAFKNVVECVSTLIKGIALLAIGLIATSLLASTPIIGSIGTIVLGSTASAAVWQGGGAIAAGALMMGVELHRDKTGQAPSSLSEYANAYKGMKIVQQASEGIANATAKIVEGAKQPDVAFHKALDCVKKATSDVAEGATKLTEQLHGAFEAAKKNPKIIHETTAKVQQAGDKMLTETKKLCKAAQEKVAELAHDVKQSISKGVGASLGM